MYVVGVQSVDKTRYPSQGTDSRGHPPDWVSKVVRGWGSWWAGSRLSCLDCPTVTKYSVQCAHVPCCRGGELLNTWGLGRQIEASGWGE